MQTSFESAQSAGPGLILLVEADDVIRSALQFILHDDNVVRAFASMEQAAPEIAEWQPDIVLLGMSLIGDEGSRVLSHINARLPDSRILIVADSAADPRASAWIGRGASDVVGKPIAVDTVRRRVALHLDAVQRRRASGACGFRPQHDELNQPSHYAGANHG